LDSVRNLKFLKHVIAETGSTSIISYLPKHCVLNSFKNLDNGWSQKK